MTADAGENGRGVLLDLDGTLVDTIPMLYAFYNDFLEQRGRKGSPEEFQRINGPSLPEVAEYLKDNQIPVYTKAKLLEVTEKGIKFLDEDKNEQFIEADTLVYCGSRITKAKKLKSQFEGVAPKIQLIGDCKRPRDIAEAMNDAQTFARRLK